MPLTIENANQAEANHVSPPLTRYARVIVDVK
jgi:hypothetical protein